MTARPSPDRGFVYAPTPMLLLDAAGRLADVNVACRELMGLDVAGCKGRNGADVVTRLATAIEGDLFSRRVASGPPPASDLGVTVSRCRFRSRRFGKATLKVVEVPVIDPDTGECTGWLLTLDVIDLEHRAAFEESRKHGWSREITWEVYAASYDRILPELPFYQEVVERHRAAMSEPALRRVLDIGAGTGSVAVPLARQGKDVTAVEVNRAMLARLSSKLDDAARARVTLVEDTAERLPQADDDAFDGVTALLSFFAMLDPWSALREAVRVLRPGGRLIVTEPRRRFDVDALMDEAARVLRARGLLRTLHDDWIRIQSVAPHLDAAIGGHEARARWDAEAIVEFLDRLGFLDVSVEDSHLGNCATITGVKPPAIRGRPGP